MWLHIVTASLSELGAFVRLPRLRGIPRRRAEVLEENEEIVNAIEPAE